MLPIQMVDLKRQYQAIKPEIDAAIQEVIDSAAFINGPIVKKFEEHLAQYLGVKHVIGCGNGTDALQIALMALGLQPGDEVISASFTFIATVEVIGLLGLKPVFVDVNRDTFNLLPAAIEAAITPQTKAIIPVHLYGQSAEMEEILAIGRKYNIPIIEDTAQAIGGQYSFSDGRTAMNGTMGTIGTTSFFPSKNLGAYGDGGAIFTNDDTLAEAIRMIANHGQKVRYYHERIGCNSRLDSIQAAILDVKLRQLNAYCDARREVADYYDTAFASIATIKTPYRAPNSRHVYHQYTITLDATVDRDAVITYLQDKGIPTMIYYPVPCHRQAMFQSVDCVVHDMTHTEALNPRVISLPIHTEMTTEELAYITEHFINAVNLHTQS